MDRRQDKRYQKDITKHETQKEKKSRQAAVRLKRAAKGKGGARQKNVTEENWDEIVDVRPSPGAPRHPLPQAGEGKEGIVIAVSSAGARVFAGGREIDCTVPAEMAVVQKSAIAVGDRVLFDDTRRLTAVLPRRSVLARPDPLNPHLQRLVAANIDVVIHVVSVKAPPLRPRLIDRYLIAIQRGGAQPVICVNKIDLLDAEDLATELMKLDTYRELGVSVIACSTRTGEGLDELRGQVLGKTSALVGHSGVGKSSILNALDSRLQLATKDVHKRGTGRHTTTASTLYDFGEGTYLIDTPGIREFGLWDLDRESLRDYFPEFEEPAESCRFNDCSHVHEPECQVKARVERGEINRARYDTYVRLYNDLEK
jgi:ribosome biogenesis GTPase / thiamine phosphate phosphatase